MQYNIRVAEVLRSVSRAADVAAARPYGFSQKVALVAMELAERVQPMELDTAALLLGGLLHGIGLAGVGGELARALVANERSCLQNFPADWLLTLVDEAGPRIDDGPMTGTFLRHHMQLSRYPELSAAWLERAGMGLAADVVGALLERWDGGGPQKMEGDLIPIESRVLALAYHLTSIRYVAARESSHPVVEDAQDLVETTDWLELLAGVVFDPALIPQATALWRDDAFWERVEFKRAPMAPGRSGEVSAEIETRGDAPADAEDEEIDTVGGAGSRAEIDELMSMYVLGLHDVDGDVPDIDRHIDNLLFAEYQGFLEPSSPVLESWLTLLGTMSDAKAAFDSGHCVRVATLAREIALILNVGDSEIREITLAGLVYGLGRLAVPSSLLESAMSLDDRQRRLVQECPRVTRSVLAPLAALGNVVTVASLYAERMDGSGYPEGRQGDSTPLGARILAVADTYEALIADRPYRPSHARSRALAIIQAQSGFLFDGLVTDSLEAVARGQI